MNGNPSSLDKSIDSKDDARSEKSESEQYYDPSSDSNNLTIFVYNIDPEISEDQFKTIFGSFGSITKLTFSTVDQKKLFAYLQYDNPASVEKAIKETQYKTLGKCEIIVVKRQEGIKLNPGGKLFIRGVADDISLRDLHQHFGQVSTGCMVYKFAHEDVRPLNTGFVHFFNPRDAQRALETLQGKELKESKLELSEWDPKGLKRAKVTQSIYVSNLPDLAKKELEDQYMAIFKSFGEIVSFIFNDHKNAALVSYKDHNDAQEALDNLTKREGCTNLVVNWVKSASERKEEAKKRKNRLHLDGLRFDVSHEMIRSEFSRFGQVVSLDTKPGRIVERRIKTQWAVIAFSTDEEAERALINGPKTKETKRLFVMNYLKIQHLGQPNKENPHNKHKNQFFSQSKPQSLHETTPKNSQPQSESQPELDPQSRGGDEWKFPPGMQPFGGGQPLISFDEQLPQHMIQPQPQQNLHFNQQMLPPMFQHLLQPQPQPQPQYQPPFNFMQMPPGFAPPNLSQPMMNMSPQNQSPQNFIQPPPQLFMGGGNTSSFPNNLSNPLSGGWPQQDEMMNKLAHPLYNEMFNLGNIGNMMPPMTNHHAEQPKTNLVSLDQGGYSDLLADAPELADQMMFNLSFMDEKPVEPIGKPTQPTQSIQPTQPTQPVENLNGGGMMNINPEDFLKKSLGIM